MVDAKNIAYNRGHGESAYLLPVAEDLTGVERHNRTERGASTASIPFPARRENYRPIMGLKMVGACD